MYWHDSVTDSDTWLGNWILIYADTQQTLTLDHSHIRCIHTGPTPHQPPTTKAKKKPRTAPEAPHEDITLNNIHHLQHKTFYISNQSPPLKGNLQGGQYDLARGNILWPTAPNQPEQLAITINHQDTTQKFHIQTPPLYMHDVPAFITTHILPFSRELTRMPHHKKKAIIAHTQHLGLSKSSVEHTIPTTLTDANSIT